MAKKTVGFVILEWVCPNCNTKNPGPQKTCISCGHPQPEDVVFIKAEQDILLTGQKEIAQAASGPDVHCPYCGTRNLSSAKICTQCGGDLIGARSRQSGQTLGAYQDKDRRIACPNCGIENQSSASFCTSCGASLGKQQTVPPSSAVSLPASAEKRKINPIIIALPVLFVILIITVIILFSGQKTQVKASVASTYWLRSIVIEEYGPVVNSDWISSIPNGAQIGKCRSEYHHTASEPEASSTEICGTPYVVDQGTGYGEVVSDCIYEVYQDKCEYTSDQWYTLTTLSLNGMDLSPAWPETRLSANQREGSRDEQYEITFVQDDDTYRFAVDSYEEFLQFTPGSTWLLSLNAFGKITDLSPVE